MRSETSENRHNLPNDDLSDWALQAIIYIIDINHREPILETI